MWYGFKSKLNATYDNKILKATYGGHQFTKRILRGREKIFYKKCNEVTST